MTSTSQLNIRPFEADDQSALIALWQACDLVRPWNDPVKDIARKLAVDPDLLVVGTLGDDIVASVMIGYEGHRGWVNYLAVSPKHQRLGLGRQLMQYAEAQLLALGCPKLNLQVRGTNSAVIAFYERLGYKDDQVTSLGKRLIVDLA